MSSLEEEVTTSDECPEADWDGARAKWKYVGRL